MQNLKRLSIIVAAFLPLLAAGKDAALALDFSKPQTITVNGKTLNFDGPIHEIDGCKMMAFGEKNYAVPAQGLVGEKGTIVIEFAFAKPMIKSPSVVRTLAVLRANGREEIGFYSFAKNPILQYRFANRRHNFYGASSKLPGGKLYKAAFSWDGDKLRCYLDGKLIKESNHFFL